LIAPPHPQPQQRGRCRNHDRVVDVDERHVLDRQRRGGEPDAGPRGDEIGTLRTAEARACERRQEGKGRERSEQARQTGRPVVLSQQREENPQQMNERGWMRNQTCLVRPVARRQHEIHLVAQQGLTAHRDPHHDEPRAGRHEREPHGSAAHGVARA
jgi:hypothetical protein